MRTCKNCPDRNTCTKVCDDVEKQLLMEGIHRADWHGHGAFASANQEKRAYDIQYQRQLENNMKRGNRCPKCGRIIGYYRKKDKTYVCGVCPWEGKNVKRPEDTTPGPNTD